MGVRSYYDARIRDFLIDDDDRILGILTAKHFHSLNEPQRWAWTSQLTILRQRMPQDREGRIFLEFYIPRMGKRADAVVIIEGIIFVLEFKVGAEEHLRSALNQVEDYALDIKNFHEGSHHCAIVPILISTHAPDRPRMPLVFAQDFVAAPTGINSNQLWLEITSIVDGYPFPPIDIQAWMAAGYRPTPTIIEAAETLYRTHSVTDIARSDASAINLQQPPQV